MSDHAHSPAAPWTSVWALLITLAISLLALLLMAPQVWADDADTVTITGSLAADAPDGTRVGLAVREEDDAHSWWSQRYWPGNQPLDGGDSFSFEVAQAEAADTTVTGDYRIEVWPPQDRVHDLPGFSVTVTFTDGQPDELADLTFPAANLTLAIDDGTDGVEDANIDISRRITLPDGGWYGERVVHPPEPGKDGRMALLLEDGEYDINASPRDADSDLRPRNTTVEIVDGTGPDGDTLTLTLPVPNVSGRVIHEDAPLAEVEVQLQRRVEEPGHFFWEYTDGVFTEQDGTFALVADDPTQPHRLRVVPQGGMALPTFTVEVTFEDGVAELGDVAVAEANVNLTVRDGSDPVADAFVHLEPVDGSNAPGGASTSADGQVAFLVDPGEYRVRVDPPQGTGLPPFTVEITVVDGETLDRVLEVPESTLDGELFLDADESEPAAGANVSVYRWVDDPFGGGWWDWAGISARTDQDGAFALALDDGTFRLTFHPPWNSTAVRFSRELTVADGKVTDGDGTQLDQPVRWSFPAPNLIVELDGGGQNLRGTHAQVQRWNDDDPFGPDDGFWEWTQAHADVRDDGTLRLVIEEDGDYRLRIEPPSATDLPAFTWEFEVSGGEVVGEGAGDGPVQLSFPAPTLAGTLRSDAGDPVGRTSLQVQRWDDDRQYWAWLDLWAQASPQGRFALLVPDDGRYRLQVGSPWDDATLVAFEVEFTVTDGLATIDDGQEDVASGTATDLQLTYPTPNLRLLLTDGDRTVRDAWIEVQRRDVDEGGTPYWRWTDTYAATDTDGRAAFRLPLEEDATFRLRIQPPWDDRSLPAFTAEVEVRDGQVRIDGTPVPDLEPVELAFPSPNLRVEVTDDDAAVRHAGIQVQQQVQDGDRWRYVEFTSTDRDGAAQLRLDPGTYRVVVDPPWDQPGLVRFSSDPFEVTEDTLVELPLTFPTPSVTGSVELAENEPARWGWIAVLDNDSGDWLEGAPISQDGTFALALPDGNYAFTVHPNRASLTPLQLEVEIAGGQVTSWRYLRDPAETDRCESAPGCHLDVSFADVEANLTGNVTRGGSAVVGAFVTTEDANGDTTTVVTDDTGRFEMVLDDLDVIAEILVTIDTDEGDGELEQWRFGDLDLDVSDGVADLELDLQ